MVSWDLIAKFEGLSPHVKELELLAKQERFSNIESIERNIDGNYLIVVNDRGLEQTKFSAEVVK